MADLPPIILIHGFPLDSAMWQPQVTFLTGLGYKVLTPNLPGFGGTAPWPAKKYSMEAMAAEIHHYILEQVNGPAIVGGFSMGGYVLLAMLKQTPEIVSAAMFLDTRADADSAEAKAIRLKMIEGIEKDGVKAAGDALKGRLLSKDAGTECKAQVLEMVLRQDPQVLIGAQMAMAKRYDHTDLLPDLAIPALVLVGAFDAITPPNVAMGMHNPMRHSTLVQIAKAGHLANMEQPEAVNQALRMFLNLVSKRGAG